MLAVALLGCFIAGIAVGVVLNIYFGRRPNARHARLIAYRAFAATLTTLADGIGADSDPRRIAATLRLKAGQWQRSADTLKPTTKEN